MKNIFYLLMIIFFFTTCKKDDEIYTTKNAMVIAPPAFDTIFTLSIYPNPCDSFINLAMIFPRASPLKISILDPLGRTAYFSSISLLAAGQNLIGFDIYSLKSGIYFVICEYDSGKMVKKMIKL